MSVSAGQEKLKTGGKDLLAQWYWAKLMWRDEVSRKFEDNHLTPLLLKLRTAQEALGRMDQVLQHLRRDCG